MEPEEDDEAPERTASRANRVSVNAEAEEPEEVGPATRIALQPVDRDSGEAIERDEVVKGYEFERGQYVTFTPAELKALDVESSKLIELATFVPRDEVDPLYYNAGYYVYPDGSIATEAYRVISAAMAKSGMAGLGRLTLNRRERMVLVEPRGAGLALITLRSAEEVRPAQFDDLDGELDPKMIAITEMIIKWRAGHFDPATFRDRYQDALRELIEAKMRGLPAKAKPAETPQLVVDLMSALKRSLAQETGEAERKLKRKAAARPGITIRPPRLRSRTCSGSLNPGEGRPPRIFVSIASATSTGSTSGGSSKSYVPERSSTWSCVGIVQCRGISQTR